MGQVFLNEFILVFSLILEKERNCFYRKNKAKNKIFINAGRRLESKTIVMYIQFVNKSHPVNEISKENKNSSF